VGWLRRRFSEGEVMCSTGLGLIASCSKSWKGEPASWPRRREEGGRALMPTYVILMNWTDQGARADRDAVRRRDQADALAEKYGARIE
jgi:hypothetical protein